MSFAFYHRRLKQLPWQDRLLLVETAVTLAATSFAIRVLPFRKVMGVVKARDRHDHLTPAAKPTISRVRWAIEACARLVPWKTVCFQKGLAMQWMLQRRRLPSLLHYGVAQDDARGLRAHVWLTYEGEGIIGADEAEGYVCLATFPAQASVAKHDEERRYSPAANAD
jgi:hypothetical protein